MKQFFIFATFNIAILSTTTTYFEHSFFGICKSFLFVPAHCSQIHYKKDDYKQFKAVFEPLTDPNAGDVRDKEWDRMDGNGSDEVSLAEYDGWVQSLLIGKYSKDEGKRIWSVFRPSYIRAFEDANDIAEGKHSHMHSVQLILCKVNNKI